MVSTDGTEPTPGTEGFQVRNPAADRAEQSARQLAEESIDTILDSATDAERARMEASITLLGEFAVRTARAALTDPLTQLPNVRALDFDLSHYGVHGFIADASEDRPGSNVRRRASDTPEAKAEAGAHKSLAVMYLDFDNFKLANDTLGHDQMDLVLVEITTRLASMFREQDILYRVGGDEFVYLFPDALKETPDSQPTFREQLDILVEEALARYPVLRQLNFGVSVGTIVFNPRIHRDFQGLKRAAELAMYDTKDRKRQRLQDPSSQ